MKMWFRHGADDSAVRTGYVPWRDIHHYFCAMRMSCRLDLFPWKWFFIRSNRVRLFFFFFFGLFIRFDTSAIVWAAMENHNHCQFFNHFEKKLICILFNQICDVIYFKKILKCKIAEKLGIFKWLFQANAPNKIETRMKPEAGTTWNRHLTFQLFRPLHSSKWDQK